MNAFDRFPTPLHWTSQQLADAVPLQLHELYAFDATRERAHRVAANVERRRARTTGYVSRAPLPVRFDIR